MLKTEQVLRAEIEKLKRNKERIPIDEQRGKYKAAFDKQKAVINQAFKNTVAEFMGKNTTEYKEEFKEALQKALQEIMDSHKANIGKFALVECNADSLMEEIGDITGEFIIAKANIEILQKRKEASNEST